MHGWFGEVWKYELRPHDVEGKQIPLFTNTSGPLLQPVGAVMTDSKEKKENPFMSAASAAVAGKGRARDFINKVMSKCSRENPFVAL